MVSRNVVSLALRFIAAYWIYIGATGTVGSGLLVLASRNTASPVAPWWEHGAGWVPTFLYGVVLWFARCRIAAHFPCSDDGADDASAPLTRYVVQGVVVVGLVILVDAVYQMVTRLIAVAGLGGMLALMPEHSLWLNSGMPEILAGVAVSVVKAAIGIALIMKPELLCGADAAE